MHPQSLRAPSLLVLVSALALGCSSSGSAEEPTGAPAGDVGATTPAPTDAGAKDAADAPKPPDLDPGEKGKKVPDAIAQRLEGTYAARMRVATVQDLPVLGKSTSTSVTYGIAVVARAGEGLTVTEQGCHVDVQSSGSVSTSVPDAIAQSVAPAAHELRAWEEASALKWARPLVVIPVGVKLADPAKDSLPTAATDPRVWDQDKDGKPGVTVKVTGFVSGDIHVVQRQRNVLAGEVNAKGDLAGLASDTSEQSVIGSSNPVLNQNIPTAPDADASKSNVVLVKDKAGLTCSDLMSRKDAIFAGRP